MYSYNKLAVLLAAFLTSSTVIGAPIHLRREVPQEHSHEQFLTSVRASLAKNNPDGISDPVFGLLGNAAAAGGQGKITNTDCLHQATADQAFTNAKAAGDVTGMTDALIYAALERNTGSVGLASVLCTAIKAVNPEIAAISQHQDPASPNAAATNKAITLELAKQIASIGGDPQQALKAGTFAPGKIGDPTAKGNSCDDANDPVGCIFTQNLLVEDATADEITAAVAGIASSANTTDVTTAASSTDAAAASSTDVAAASSTAAAAANTAQCVAVSPPATTTDAAVTTTDAAATTTDAAATTTAAAAASTDSITAVSAGTLDFGSCTDPAVQFGFGFDNRNANSFEPRNQTQFNHGSALNIAIVTEFICDNLVNQCKAPAATVAICRTAQAVTGPGGGASADQFNAALGIQTNFAANPVDEPAALSSTGTLNFGSCTNPAVQFGLGFDGRTENSFEPEDQTEFNHGSALNIAIVTQFICDRLNDQCLAPASTVTACRAAQALTNATAGAAADQFNAALKITTNFAQNPVNGSAASTTAAAATTTAAAGASTASTAGNLQKFNTGLGNILPPAVIASGTQFSVTGNASFSSLANALTRSCDVQHNQCANFSNAAGQNPPFSVGDCATQQTACNAANA
ncbi:hypothetical protein FRB93_010926 [Tulasnella sp. JGI-2019a]|nr:hypothetical protein FRB93_010926 [Tulasnella sp. JGI-2019a]